MQFKGYVKLWFLFTAVVLYEHLAIKFFPENSITQMAKANGFLNKDFLLSTAPGKPMSFYLGWTGFGVMLCTNFYIFRKRFSFLKSLGKLNNWLNFHIFLGMLGPMFIIFHTDFKIRGIVAISFWSMIIAASSGFVGRYFYINSARKQKDLKDASDKIFEEVKKLIKDGPTKEKTVEELRLKAIKYMCLSSFEGRISFFALPKFITYSMLGDSKVFLGFPVIDKYPKSTLDIKLKKFGVSKRNEIYADTYRRLLSYWHNFHLPFTFFMYITAIIHIVSSYMFKVS